MSDLQHTRALVVVHSHIQQLGNGVVDCSPDVVQIQTSKTIKGTGGASFTLVPRKNYFNYIFPNDLVNIYFDPGDGVRGFVRTFFGYVDRIDRTIVTNEQGATQTAFVVTCTDFAKAVDKTDIYFNPMLATRAEFQGTDFANGQLGGHALRTKGITAHGSPAHFVENLLELLLGFGTQWTLPRSYPTQNFLSQSRAQRRQRLKAQLPASVVNDVQALFNANIEDFLTKNSDIDTVLQQKLQSIATTAGVIGNIPSNYYEQQAKISNILSALLQLQAYQTVLNESSKSSAASVYDIISTSFIESLAIDGFIASQQVWWTSGTLASIIYGYCNEIVNELCFDLRPVAGNAADDCFGTTYSTEPDELGYNTNGLPPSMSAGVQAVKYVPAVIMREYPYSVVEGLDLTGYHIDGTVNTNVGFQPFGPVFAQGVGTEGRKIYNYQTQGVESLSPEKCFYAPNGAPMKHLDVVVVKDTDIQTEQIGRSDADIFNFYEMTSTDLLGTNWKWMLNDIMPVMTPISVLRHGLRLRQMQTRFANYSRDQLCSGSSGIDTAQIRYNLLRWGLMIDHWFQHNVEYLSGTMSLRARPEIRVGYRIDRPERSESYYVDSVNHHWEYPGAMATSVTVSRGQRNDPFPAYIPPVMSKVGGLPAGSVNPGELLGAAGSSAVAALGAGINTTIQQQLNAAQDASSSPLATQGGGDRGENGRLANFFQVRDTKATENAVGGSPTHSDQNDVDLPANIAGPAEFPPPQTATRYNKTPADQIGDFTIPDTGKKNA
jgi:hypothetical protein